MRPFARLRQGGAGLRPLPAGSRGAVLAELVMTTIIGALLLSVLPGFYFAYIKLWRQETARLGASEQATQVIRTMKTDIRNARRATLSSDGTVLTLMMPMLAYDADLQVMSVAVGADGGQIDGDVIEYYFEQDPNHTGSSGGNVYRRVTRAGGAQQTPRLVADSVYPTLNPLSADTGSPVPLFYHDEDKDTVIMAVTASEPRPSSGTLIPTSLEPICTRDGGAFVRVATDDQPEGAIRCAKCGAQARPSTELITYRTEIRLRNH